MGIYSVKMLQQLVMNENQTFSLAREASRAHMTAGTSAGLESWRIASNFRGFFTKSTPTQAAHGRRTSREKFARICMDNTRRR